MGAALVAALFASLVFAGIAFAVWPVARARQSRAGARTLAAWGVVLAVLLVGGGSYVFLGSPQLALRGVAEPHDVPALIAAMASRARTTNFDVTGWTLLGRGYLSLDDPTDAAAAFRRGLQVAPRDARTGLSSALGEALTMAARGTVTPEAEDAFRAALAGNPKDFAARYYLGLAYAARGQNAEAITLWNGLLADSPPNAPWRGQVVDHIAALQAGSGGAPDISAMVAQLAERLKTNPADPAGWQRLVRAYAVLGQNGKARSALADAKRALKSDAAAQAALDGEAHALKLE